MISTSRPARRLSPKGRQQRTVQECVTLRPPSPSQAVAEEEISMAPPHGYEERERPITMGKLL